MQLRSALFWIALTGLRAASLHGIVSDPTGAPVPGAVVTLSGVATSTATTGMDGRFSIAAAAGQTHILSVDQPGFRTWRRDDIVVNDEDVKITLDLAPQSDSVVVSEQVGAVDPSSSQTGETLNEREVRAVPLNGRSATDLLAI